MPVHYVNSIADMTASSAVNGDTVIVGGYHTLSDGGGGYFQCFDMPIVPIDWQTPDKGLIFVGDKLDVWFQRIVDTPYISVKWFGAWGDNDHDDTDAINRAFNAALNHGSMPTICDSGNTMIKFDATPNTIAVATRTRIYFPAGIYCISGPIAVVAGNTFAAYDAYCLEIVGEQSAIRPHVKFSVGNFPAMHLNPRTNLKISELTFAGFDDALKLEGNNQAIVVLDNVGFTDINNKAIEINCPNATITLNYIKWYPVQYPIWLKNGNVSVVGGWVTNKPFKGDNDGMFIIEKGYLNIENVMGAPTHGPYALTCGWIKNLGGSVRCENMRFGGEHLQGHVILNYAKGQIYQYKSGAKPQPRYIEPITLEFIDCLCNPVSAIKLFEIPNSIIFESCVGFNFFDPLVVYGGNGSLQDKLDELSANFSISLDNVPYFRSVLNGVGQQANNLYTPKFGLLPYVKVNNGFDSYGYVQDDDCEMPEPKLLKFFMGKESSDGTIFGGIYGDYSYEVYLSNVSDFTSIPSHPEMKGNIYQYCAYRIEVYIDRSNPMVPVTKVSQIEDITPAPNTDPDAPVIIRESDFKSNGNPNLLYVTTFGNSSASGTKRKFGIFYEIRSLIPPVVVPFGAVN